MTMRMAGFGLLMTGVMAAAQPAAAADLGTLPRGVAAVPANEGTRMLDRWATPYLGLTLGYVDARAKIDRGAGQGDFTLDDKSVTLGVVAGANYAPWGGSPFGRWLVGVEVDLAGLRDGKVATDAVLGSVRADHIWLGSVRGRAGYAWEHLFVYGTAGLAVTDMKVRAEGARKDNVIRTGLALGAGVEAAVNENWTARVEGLVYGFRGEDETLGGAKRDVDMSFGVVRAGVVRRF